MNNVKTNKTLKKLKNRTFSHLKSISCLEKDWLVYGRGDVEGGRICLSIQSSH